MVALGRQLRRMRLPLISSKKPTTLLLSLKAMVLVSAALAPPRCFGGGEDAHAAEEVAQRARPVLLGAYEVTLYLIVAGRGEDNHDTMDIVAGDEVMLIGRGAPDGSVGYVGAEAYVVEAVAPVCGARRVGFRPDGYAREPKAVLTSIAERARGF
jgi:hypothetical protein